LTRTRALFALTFLWIGLTASLGYAADPAQQPDPNAGKRKVRVTIYPLLVQAPIFGASVDLPPLPSGPGGGGGGGNGGGESGDVSGSTNVSLNAAYLAGFLVETDRWFVEGSGTWADISADRTLPRVNVGTKTLIANARGGWRLFKDISATGGVHHLSTDLDVTLQLPNLDQTIEGRAKPGFWDPMIGVDWRRDHGRWAFDANFEGGGFGVGTDVDLFGEVRADYRFGHFDLRIGYAFTHLKATIADVSIGQFQRTLVINQTLHGPSVGFGITF
jgi:hypothetical protein